MRLGQSRLHEWSRCTLSSSIYSTVNSIPRRNFACLTLLRPLSVHLDTSHSPMYNPLRPHLHPFSTITFHLVSILAPLVILLMQLLRQVDIRYNNAVQRTGRILGCISRITTWVILVLEMAPTIAFTRLRLPRHAVVGDSHSVLGRRRCRLAAFLYVSSMYLVWLGVEGRWTMGFVGEASLPK